MKVSNKFWLNICICFSIITIISALVHGFRDYFPCKHGIDIRLRQNEICCSHTGVNPFNVWNGDVKSDTFKGFRPDMTFDEVSAKRAVHAYPAWHTTFMWFYGWLPQSVLMWGMVLLNLFIFVILG